MLLLMVEDVVLAAVVLDAVLGVVVAAAVVLDAVVGVSVAAVVIFRRLSLHLRSTFRP